MLSYLPKPRKLCPRISLASYRGSTPRQHSFALHQLAFRAFANAYSTRCSDISQNAEASAFIARVARLPPGPNISLDGILGPSLADEAEIRRLFAQEKDNPRLKDPYVGLVNVFNAPSDIRTTRARVVATPPDLDESYIMPLDDTVRRKEGSPAMVSTLEEFKQNWAIFTEGSLAQLTDWSNVIAAGGAVQACLSPVPDSAKVSKRALRKHFHSQAFPSSDIDLFLYGLTPEQAEAKMNVIFEAVRDSIPWDVTCIRTKHTISIHSQYPYRAVQIVLRLYQSPAEVLAGFDVDAPCCAYDGNRVYASPRAIVAMMRQCNTVDVTRRSPSYEVRLTKYSSRGFEIYVPQLNREDIDPTIFERSITRIQGLARLLVLEKLGTPEARESYIESRKQVRGRPSKYRRWYRRSRKHYRGDLKDTNMELEMSDYDVVSLHIPYGPGWDARRIEKLVYKSDYGMNSPYNPKNKGRFLHRHTAFFGTMQQVIEDCCENCPEPEDEEERELQEEEDKSYVRGRVQFIVEDPGRQSISGSFNPIDDGEWAEQAYMGPTEKFFQAIAANDLSAIDAAIQGGIDVDRRDHVGRTPLQLAILAKSVDAACMLIDAGARMTYRLVDGRTTLHLAAQLDLPVILRKLLERSKVNDERAKAAEDGAKQVQEADLSSGDGNEKKKGEEETEDAGLIPEDEEDVPDVFEINAPDWDYNLTPLLYAVLARSPACVELLCQAGADPKLITTPSHKYNAPYTYPLMQAINIEDDDTACQITQTLITAGAITSEADDNLYTMLHRGVDTSRPKIVLTFLRHDPNAKAVVNIPWMNEGLAMWPVVSALQRQSYAMLAVLLAHGGKVVIDEDDFGRARDLLVSKSLSAPGDLYSAVPMPLDVALSNMDECLHLLVALGADVNRIIRRPKVYWNQTLKGKQRTPLDFVRHGLAEIVRERQAIERAKQKKVGDSSPRANIQSKNQSQPISELPSPIPAWQTYLLGLIDQYDAVEAATREGNAQKMDARVQTFRVKPRLYLAEHQTYFQDAEATLLAHGAKTADELFPPGPSPETKTSIISPPQQRQLAKLQEPVANNAPKRVFYGIKPPFNFHRHGMNEGDSIRPELALLYSELFTAIWEGNHSKVQELCLPPQGRKVKNTPLQVSVHWGDSSAGFSALYLAILARRWDTAKLVLAIATAQHRPKEQKEMRMMWNSRDVLADDPDEELDEMMDEWNDDYTAEDEPIDLVDIAKRPSEVYTTIGPKHMLENIYAPAVNKNGKGTGTYAPLGKAVEDDDLEAFEQVLGMHRSLPDHSFFAVFSSLETLLKKDRVNLLDEYIRQTGFGVTIRAYVTEDAAGEGESGGKRCRKEYLGLNVDGRKRGDLAQAAEGHHYQGSNNMVEIPLLWKAIQAGARNIVDYLATHKSLEAYRIHATSGGDVQAKMLKAVPDLANVLPELLGWATNGSNETALTAAVVARNLEVLEQLFVLRPDEMKAAVQLRHRTHGCNSVLLAAKLGCTTDMLDFLVSKGASPTENDAHGRNIFHILLSKCTESHFKLLKHILEKLPRDDIHALLKKRDENLETPLYIACRQGRIDVVELLLSTGAPQFLIRCGSGSTALHVAVDKAFAKITKLLVEAGPTEWLDLENSVGTTPLEIATRPVMLAQLNVQNKASKSCSYTSVSLSSNPFDLSRHEQGLPVLRETLADLVSEGKLASGTKVVKAFEALADKIEARIAREKALAEEWKKALTEANVKAAEARKDVEKPWAANNDYENTVATLKVLKEALAARPTQRRLIHLSDVHDSVKRSLESYGSRSVQRKPIHDEDEGSTEAPVQSLPYSPLIPHY